MSSSPVSAALEELSRLPASDRALLPGQCPGLAEYLAWVPDPWPLADRALHYLRDVSYGEDASQIRTGSGPQAMAALRNLATGILKTAGHASITAACTPPRPGRHQDPRDPPTRHE